MSDVVIKAENLGKMYTIGHQAERGGYTSLRDVWMQNARTLWNKTKDLATGKPIMHGDTLEEVWALKDVSFEIKRGEAVGIIGRNGAGKSTLLKILSRITEPTSGRVTIDGRVASLLEVGTGFHPELTGRENIYLNGTILGMTRKEIKRKFDEIVAFAEVEKYLDTPVKRYSSGMYVRLAFAVAAHLEPEILIVDEVLAVGDTAFQKKCMGKMGEVAEGGRTVLFVSHNMAAVRTLCGSVLILNSGLLDYCGDVQEAIQRYYRGTEDVDVRRVQYINESNCNVFSFKKFWLQDETGNSVSKVFSGRPAALVIEYETSEVLKRLSFALGVFDMAGNRLTRLSMEDKNEFIEMNGRGIIKCVFNKFPFSEGKYILTLGAYEAGQPLSIVRHAVSLCVEDDDYYGNGSTRRGARCGPLLLEHSWASGDKQC